MPSRAWVVTFSINASWPHIHNVSMPSRAWVVTLRQQKAPMILWVSMPSRAWVVTVGIISVNPHWIVSMPSRAWVVTIYGNQMNGLRGGFNALSGLYLISTVPLQKPRFYAVSRACFCRYLSEYSDNSCFSCMLTFWTYLMRFTYPWHWIKYSTKYNRCHPIFHSLDKLSWAVTRYPLGLLLRLLCTKCILLFIELL